MINVIKATGEIEPFSENKLRDSIRRAGIDKKVQDEAVENIKSRLYDKMPTSEIYKLITLSLEASKPFGKSKYSLKQAIKDLGPTGYPFEDFVAQILKSQGYKTNVRQILQGKCVSHEIDVIAEKENKRIMIEAKFHNGSGTRTELHVSLYTKARFDDIKEKNNLNEAWLITNTKATSEAVNYALCSKMNVVSWSYPDRQGLRDLIEEAKLHPITALSRLSQTQKQQLLENHIVLCREVCDTPEVLDILHLANDRKKEVLNEARAICESLQSMS